MTICATCDVNDLETPAIGWGHFDPPTPDEWGETPEPIALCRQCAEQGWCGIDGLAPLADEDRHGRG